MKDNVAPHLSAILIVRNEERDLPGCLESLRGVADEIVVVDSGSTDRTVSIAQEFGARVIHRDFAGFGPQKQFALEQATGEWVLNMDADERLSPALQDEIKSVLAGEPAVHGYHLRFQNVFLGRRLRFGGLWGERHLRLFRRDKGHYVGKEIHEGISVVPPLGKLRSRILHESYRNFSEYLDKCNRYSGLIARDKFRQGRRFTLWTHARLPWEFVIRYVVKLGFLDGNAGFIYAVLSSYYTWLKLVRVMEGEVDGR
ncbi:MAG: glycosyltransferase family 2 protein [Elusimicrobia bacterium]|nr:glycosyltransferase family 2 protein [Elusimicrobiota bacterium]